MVYQLSRTAQLSAVACTDLPQDFPLDCVSDRWKIDLFFFVICVSKNTVKIYKKCTVLICVL